MRCSYSGGLAEKIQVDSETTLCFQGKIIFSKGRVRNTGLDENNSSDDYSFGTSGSLCRGEKSFEISGFYQDLHYKNLQIVSAYGTLSKIESIIQFILHLLGLITLLLRLILLILEGSTSAHENDTDDVENVQNPSRQG